MIRMFPTRVGMNRGPRTRRPGRLHVPHPRGDEPVAIDLLPQFLRMFPTRVGMNRGDEFEWVYASNVPHPRGDEPRRRGGKIVISTCSPPAWG